MLFAATADMSGMRTAWSTTVSFGFSGFVSKHVIQDLICSSIAAGDVVDGLKEGYGSLYAINSCSQYEGKWHSGKRHGSGKLR